MCDEDIVELVQLAIVPSYSVLGYQISLALDVMQGRLIVHFQSNGL